MIEDCDIDVLARTIYGEARGEFFRADGGIASLIAVANVVMNRLNQRTWFGDSITGVCLKPWQFSCWNKNDPNYSLLREPFISDNVFAHCMKVADQVVFDEWPDLTGGANHYHTVGLSPKWSDGQKPCFKLGRHIFYNIV